MGRRVAFRIEHTTREPQLRRVTRQRLQLCPEIQAIASTAAVVELDRPAMPCSDRVARNPEQRRQARSRAREQQRTIELIRQVEAFAKRARTPSGSPVAIASQRLIAPPGMSSA